MKIKVNTAAEKKPGAQKATSKPAATKKETVIKYADKSAGQPQLIPIFNQLTALLKPYANAALKAQEGTGGMYNLTSTKPVHILGKEREVFFAAAMVQKGFVGFYFFPIYTHPEIAAQLPPELLKCLKGKSCFHLKKEDPILLAQVKDALAIGHALYRQLGWL